MTPDERRQRDAPEEQEATVDHTAPGNAEWPTTVEISAEGTLAWYPLRAGETPFEATDYSDGRPGRHATPKPPTKK